MINKRDTIAEIYITKKQIEIFEAFELTESRIDFLKKANKDKISTEHDPLGQHKDSDSIIDHMSNQDPTKKKLYTQWLVNNYKKGGFKQEDAYRITDDLAKFDAHKHRLDKKDINQYKDPSELKDAVKDFGEHIPKSEAEHQSMMMNKEAKTTPGIHHIYGDDTIDAYHVGDKDASMKVYGGRAENGRTDWCTAHKDGERNYFDSYNKTSPLITIHRKKDGEVFQFHTADGGSFMDRHDNTISHDDFNSIKDSFHKLLRHNNNAIEDDNIPTWKP